MPYNPEQKLDYKAQDPERRPIQAFVEINGKEFPIVLPPGREIFQSAPPSTPVSELDGEGRHRGKRKCKKCGLQINGTTERNYKMVY